MAWPGQRSAAAPPGAPDERTSRGKACTNRRNRHGHICQSLELFAAKVMPEFKKDAAEREANKAADLAPYIEAAMKRKRWMASLEDHEIPVAPASRPKAQINETAR